MTVQPASQLCSIPYVLGNLHMCHTLGMTFARSVAAVRNSMRCIADSARTVSSNAVCMSCKRGGVILDLVVHSSLKAAADRQWTAVAALPNNSRQALSQRAARLAAACAQNMSLHLLLYISSVYTVHFSGPTELLLLKLTRNIIPHAIYTTTVMPDIFTWNIHQFGCDPTQTA